MVDTSSSFWSVIEEEGGNTRPKGTGNPKHLMIILITHSTVLCGTSYSCDKQF